MKPTYPSRDREKIVADAIWPVATELRMIDVADLIAMLRFERHADLSDIVASAAELFYLPDTVKLGIGGDFERRRVERGGTGLEQDVAAGNQEGGDGGKQHRQDIGDLRSPAGQIPAGRLRFQDVDLVVGHLSGGDGLVFPRLADRMPVILVPDRLEFRVDNVVRHARTPSITGPQNAEPP